MKRIAQGWLFVLAALMLGLFMWAAYIPYWIVTTILNLFGA